MELVIGKAKAAAVRGGVHQGFRVLVFVGAGRRTTHESKKSIIDDRSGVGDLS